MTQTQKIIRPKLRVLKLAKQLGNSLPLQRRGQPSP